MTYDNIPAELRVRPQCVCWGAQGIASGAKEWKVPYNPSTGQKAKANQPDTWAAFETACAGVAAGYYYGIGFEFSETDPFVGVDFDHCIQGGKLDQNVAAWVEQFNSYTEVSPSGTGLHILCKGKLPGGAIKTAAVEIYDRGRYFTLTGNVYGPPRPLRDAQDVIDAMYTALTATRQQPDDKPTEQLHSGVDLTDEKLLEIATNAKNSELFTALFTGNWPGRFPSQSEADITLCNLLAFYTGRNPEQMDRLFRQSGLMRDKWDRPQSGSTYGVITIKNAIRHCKQVFDPRSTATEDFGILGSAQPGHKLNTISAADLQSKEIPPIRYVVVDMFPQGLSLLASPPKYGKSWFVLDLCLSVAAGRSFLNHQTIKSGCLYLALEDSERRLKDRMNKVLEGDPAPEHFDYATSALDIGQGLIGQLESYVDEHPNTALIVIDTLQKVRAVANGKESAYSTDYREVGTLKTFADRHGICLLLVHHLRKMADDTDPFNRISGTNGIMGAVDTALVMSRKSRNDPQTVLSITGRDVESQDVAIEFSKENYKWCVLGNAEWIAEQQARMSYQTNPIVITVRKLLEQNPGGWSGSMQQLINKGMELANTALAESPRALSSKIKTLDRPLFDYDHIIHTRPGNGRSGGGYHKFYYSQSPTTGDMKSTAAEDFTELPNVN